MAWASLASRARIHALRLAAALASKVVAARVGSSSAGQGATIADRRKKGPLQVTPCSDPPTIGRNVFGVSHGHHARQQTNLTVRPITGFTGLRLFVTADTGLAHIRY